jgi:ligand-binding sensor domain-containing protein
LEEPLSETLKIAKVFSFEQIGKTQIAFGTVLKGMYIADLNGKILHHVNRHKGLPSNTVLSLHYSKAGKLWLGMDYGATSLNLKNNFTYFFDYRGDFGTGYTALLKDDDFYLGTNQGLYRSNWEGLNNNLEFFRVQIIPDTEGQVWTLENIDNTILMGHDKGLFIVR